jgi:signal transduction histidine kinase
MHPFDELRAYVGFTVEDERRLAALRDHALPHTKAIADRFYERVLQFEGARTVFEDLRQVERLKLTLQRWISELLTGPWDHAYWQMRRRIGEVHVRVRLPSQYMFTAMNRLMEELHAIARAALPPEQQAATAESLRRITDIELAIMLSTYIDEREQRGLEDLRHLLISNLPMTVLLLDKSGRVATSTSPQNDLFTRQDLVGVALEDALRPEIITACQLRTQIERAFASKREILVPRVEVEIDGSNRALRVSVVPLEHALANTFVHIEDLTETVAFEARARHAEHLARIGTLAASVAHEIRNPLAGISGTVQVIASSLGEEDERTKALRKVQEQIARLGALVGDLLSFSRPVSAHCRPIEIKPAVAYVVQQAAASEGSAAVIEGDGHAHADAALLGEVLLNLVQNAWQAGAQKVVVQIADGRVRVFDDGPGVKKEDRERIFEPFFTTKVRGTGLGLPMARKLVEAMRGTLELGRSPLGGAAFDIRLPVRE